MFKKQQNINGILNIGEKYVSIKTDINYQMVEIKYVGHIKMFSSLSNNYVLKNGRSAIVIIKKNTDNIIVDKLFRYLGSAKITSCKIYDNTGRHYKIYINRTALTTWNSLSKTIVLNTSDIAADENDLLQTWDNLERNWEDLSFNGNNQKINYLHTYTNYNQETKKTTLIREIRSY